MNAYRVQMAESVYIDNITNITPTKVIISSADILGCNALQELTSTFTDFEFDECTYDGDEFRKFFSANSRIETLKISNMRLENGIVEGLRDLLKTNKVIRSLTLENIEGRCIIGERLAEGISTNESIESISISITDPPADAKTDSFPMPLLEVDALIKAFHENDHIKSMRILSKKEDIHLTK